MAILRVLGCLLLVALIGACSRSGNLGMIRRVNPPVASIQQLALRDDGSWHLVLRLNNFSTVPMRFMLVESRLWIDGADAGRFELLPAMQVPRLNAEVQDLDFEPAPPSRTRLRAVSATASRAASAPRNRAAISPSSTMGASRPCRDVPANSADPRERP